MTTTVPATLDAAIEELNGIESLLTAKGWERAAIVAAFTTDGQGSNQHRKKVSNALSISDFADLGIAGMASRPTVRLYRDRWIEHGTNPNIGPGDEIIVPDLDWPPQDRNVGSRVAAEPEAAVRQVIEKHGPAAIASAIADQPEVLGKMVEADPDKPAALEAARLRAGKADTSVADEIEKATEVTKGRSEKQKQKARDAKTAKPSISDGLRLSVLLLELEQVVEQIRLAQVPDDDERLDAGLRQLIAARDSLDLTAKVWFSGGATDAGLALLLESGEA